MLRRQPERILLNSLTATTILTTAGGVKVEGFGTILAAEVINCYKQCTSAGTAQETTVTVVIPDACECPYEWGMTIRGLVNNADYSTNSTFGSQNYYGYSDPAGATPTAAATATALIE